MNRISEALLALFHQVWTTSAMAVVLVLLIAVLLGMLKHHLKPRWHYLMWLLVIARLILPWGPESEFSIYNWIGNSAPAAVQTGPAALQPTAAVHETITQFIYPYLCIVWLAGAGLLGAYSLAVNLGFARKTRKEITKVTDARLLRIFNECKQMMATEKSITLVESPSAATPSLYGFLRPQLILPQGIAKALNDTELRHVFLHEWAHRRRNDIWVNGCMHLLLIVHWFNPFLWYAASRMREEQEIASDALALNCLAPDQRLGYGHTLIKLLENLSQPLQLAGNVNLAGNKKQLQRRIQMIARFKSNSYRWSALGIATLIFISGCALTNPKESESASQAPDYALSDKQSATAPPAQSSPSATAAPTSKAGTTGDVTGNVPGNTSSDASAKASGGKQPQAASAPAASEEAVLAPAPIARGEGTKAAAQAKADQKPMVVPSNPKERSRTAATTEPSAVAGTRSSSTAVSLEAEPRAVASTRSSSTSVPAEAEPRAATGARSSSTSTSLEAEPRAATGTKSSSASAPAEAATKAAAPVLRPSAAAKSH
ncbi:M56 family metallopeptidase [Paenibacillus sp. BAC0078]